MIKLAKEKLKLTISLNNGPVLDKNVQNVDDDSKINNLKPSFILPKDKSIQIKLDEEKSETVKIVLEFLYTDRVMSLEGKGCYFF